MEHLAVRRELADRARSLLAPDQVLPKILRPYQSETLGSLLRWIEDPSGTRRAYVQHATGLGKTVTFSSLLRYCVGLKVLVVVPSKTLIVQTARVLALYTGGLVGHLSSLDEIYDKEGKEIVATRGHRYQSIVVTTDATLKRHAQAIARDYGPQIIIRDECHWGYSEASQQALAYFPDAAIIGFTATADYLSTVAKPDYLSVRLESGHVLYGDPKRFARTHFSTLLDLRTARWGMENGYLCELAWADLAFKASLDNLRVQDGPGGMDYDEASLQNLMRTHWPATCDMIRRLYEDPDLNLRERQVFATCPGVEAAQDLAKVIADIGVPTACITGKTRDERRNDLLNAFDRREIPLITSVMVLREGWDAPEAEVGLMLRFTLSRLFYEQTLGRILRPFEDGRPKVALAFDLHAQSATFGPLNAPMVYGLTGEAIRERDVIVRRRGDDARPESPFLPSNVEPRLMVVPEIQIEHWADQDDMVRVEGELYASSEALCRFFQINPHAFWWTYGHKRSNEVRTVTGRNHVRRIETFFRVTDLERLIGRPATLPPPATVMNA